MRLFMISFFILFTTFSYSQQSQPPSHKQPSNQSQTQKNPSKPTITANQLTSTNPPQNINNKSEEKYYKDIWDLCLVIFTGILAITGIIQARISADTAKRQLRAYLTLYPSTDKNLFTIQCRPGTKFQFCLDAQNDGATPALQCKFQGMIKILENRPTKDDLRGIENTPITTWNINPGRKTAYTVPADDFFDDKDWVSAIQGVKFLIFIGKVSYVDIFKKHHLTIFCYRFTQSQHGYTWMSIGPNTSDDETA